MPPLNPFLAAFFKSPIAAQCSPVHHFVLLVPETHVLLTYRETDSGAASVRDVINTEEFLASHVLRIPPSSAIGLGKDAGHTLRDMKGKAKQFNTLNGRNVIMKDALIFTNKGFKATAQAQVVNDATWYPDVFEAKPWLVYYISKPLIGNWEEVKIIPAVLPSPDQPKSLSEKSTAGPSDPSPKKKDIATFHELLTNFPMIARQMQPGLESLFNEFSQVFQKPLPPPPSATAIPDPRPDGPIAMAMKRARSNSMSNITTGSQASLPVTEDFFAEDDEDIMRASLETAVTTAIDLFQNVDKQQLSLLGATTDLTGPIVEKLLERYITENIHHMLFSKLASLRRPEDLELEAKIRQMEHVDISQLGLSFDGGLKSKHDLIIQLGPAIEEFKKLSNAMSPQEMLDILLSTMKTVSQLTNTAASDDINDMPAEKAIMTVNADTLVSLLLYVVIRAQIKNLHARVSYIRNFIFVEDVDSGEMGYALSTFEAVLTYLVSDSAGLRRASRKNKALWDAAKKADMLELRKIMEPTNGLMHLNGAADDDISARDLYGSAPSSRRNSVSWASLNGGSRRPSISLPTDTTPSTGSGLSHVFPFQNGEANEDEATNYFNFRPKIKRVSMETRSLSSMSDISYHSRTTSIGTLGSAFEGDISVERLAQTSDSFGESVLMLAVQNQHANVVRYLLSLRGYFPWENVIEDMNNEDTTLLSAAVQLGNMELIEMILDYVMQDATHEQLLHYVRRQDIWGRSVGHYLFNAPSLISRVGKLVPWRQRDKNGQTPLFALCRSYDHSDYYDMVEAGMKAARIAQGDDEWLHVDQHVDGKGNTLLHIMSDPRLAFKVLHQSDVDVNAKNEKKFTPLMVASKYGRYDMVRALFADPRVDLAAREARGLTAVELAKDEDVRNKIDDLGLFSMPAAEDGRITGVVRGFFVEDGTVRLVLKSAAPTDHDSYTVTTSRRSQGDFEQLARLLAEENPASWIPAVSEMRSPFQLPSKPSRALLRDIQLRSDWFLRIMLNHPSLARHEMLWEFFLVPELQLGAMEQRTNLKVEARRERVRDEFEPVRDLRDVEQFVNHAKESVRSVNHATKSVTRRANSVGLAASDLHDASVLLHRAVSTLPFLPEAHLAGLEMYASSLAPSTSGPNAVLHSTLIATQSTIQALLSALSRPTAIINHITTARREAERSDAGVGKGARWPLGLLDDTRQRMQDEKEKKALKWRLEADLLSRELRYTQQVVASELAGWQSMHDAMARQAVKDYARGMVLAERMRLQGMQRALRTLREGS